MKIYNRSAITITYKQPLIDWHNSIFEADEASDEMLKQSTLFLVDENFDAPEKLIKKHYKNIFEITLESICLDENEWPKNRTFKTFNEWFSYEISDFVYDISNKALESEDLFY